MQVGKNWTLVGWKSGQTTYVPLYSRTERRERGYGLCMFAVQNVHNLHYCHLPVNIADQEKIPNLPILAFCITGKGGIYWGECKSVAQRPNPKSLTVGIKSTLA